jgi:hypothetical protein
MEAAEPKERKRGFWNKFYNFLAMGGFMLVIIAIVAIYFAISILTQPSPDKGITILSPKANDVVKAEDSYEVLWKAELAESEIGAMVTVEFSKDRGRSWEKVGENVPNSGKYMWKVPKVDSTQCLVRVCSQSRPKFRGTSKVFVVK